MDPTASRTGSLSWDWQCVWFIAVFWATRWRPMYIGHCDVLFETWKHAYDWCLEWLGNKLNEKYGLSRVMAVLFRATGGTIGCGAQLFCPGTLAHCKIEVLQLACDCWWTASLWNLDVKRRKPTDSSFDASGCPQSWAVARWWNAAAAQEW